MNDSRALTLLFNAVLNNDLFLLQEVLMDYPSIDVNQADLGSMSALHVAAEKGYSSCVTILLASGARIDQRDEHGITPLMTGVSADFPLVVYQLLRGLANPNLPSFAGSTPLHLACKNKNVGIVLMLLGAGANPNCLNAAGNSPLSIALESTIKSSCLDIVQTLICDCWYVDVKEYAKSKNQPHPMYDCLMTGNFYVAKMLLSSGYQGVLEIKHFLAMNKSQWNKFTKDEAKDSESNSLNFIQNHGCCALSLKQICRNLIRRNLLNDIYEKVNSLHFPMQLKRYLTYKDTYEPPHLCTERDIGIYFHDNSRELY